MLAKQITEQILIKKSFLCIGLDTDIDKIPKHLLSRSNPILEFNKQIISATQDLCVAYKLNTAFYEVLGAQGWDILKSTVELMPKNIFTIADAKRGDIGNTSSYYAKAFFENLKYDAITVAPYMGSDSVKPFLEYKNNVTIVLGATSNEGADDFQFLRIKNNGMELFKSVISAAVSWGNEENLMFVVGATRPELFKEIRKIIPNHFLLVPGVGAQGGSLKAVASAGLNQRVGLLVNASRNIIYAGSGEYFADEARNTALLLQKEMKHILIDKRLLK
jgi:orotidine-5'-phosphate decarboxylase